MNINFDKETDTVYLRFSDSEIAESDEEKPGIIIDYDKDGEIAGIELLEVQPTPEALGFGVVGLQQR